MNFGLLTAYDIDDHPVYINRHAVTAIEPHPTVTNVCIVHVPSEQFVVNGSVDVVVNRLRTT